MVVDVGEELADIGRVPRAFAPVGAVRWHLAAGVADLAVAAMQLIEHEHEGQVGGREKVKQLRKVGEREVGLGCGPVALQGGGRSVRGGGAAGASGKGRGPS